MQAAADEVRLQKPSGFPCRDFYTMSGYSMKHQLTTKDMNWKTSHHRLYWLNPSNKFSLNATNDLHIMAHLRLVAHIPFMEELYYNELDYHTSLSPLFRLPVLLNWKSLSGSTSNGLSIRSLIERYVKTDAVIPY